MDNKDKNFLFSFSNFELEKIKSEKDEDSLHHYTKLLWLFRTFDFNERNTKLLLILLLKHFSKLPNNDQVEIIESINNYFGNQNSLGTGVGGDVSNISKIEYDFEGNSLDFFNGR